MRNDLERIEALSFFFGHAARFVYLSLKVIVNCLWLNERYGNDWTHRIGFRYCAG